MSSSNEGKGNITKDNAMVEMLREREADSGGAEGSWITGAKKKKKKKEPARENRDRHREPGCTRWTKASRNDKRRNNIKRSKPIRGGDSIASESGAAMTLSVAFQGTGNFEGRTYGLTCNRLINEGDSDEIFLMTTSSNSNAESNQRTIKIGNVVSRDEETDSLIFEFHRGVKVDVNTIKTGPGPDDAHEIDMHKHLTSYPSAGLALVAFGSQRRVTYGRVVPGERPPNLPSSAIGIEPNDLGSQPGSELISHAGDCGMIYVDENGNPIAMHVGFTAKKINGGDTLYRSWAIDLYEIMGHHKREYFEGVHNYPDNALLASGQASPGRAKPLTNTRRPRNGNLAINRGFPVQGHVPIFDELPIETQLKILLELADGEAERAKLLARLAAEESKRATDGVSKSNNNNNSKRLPIETHLKIQLELADDEAERAKLLAAEESKRANDDS